MLKKFAIVLSVAALSATVACSKTEAGVNHSVKSQLAKDDTTKGSDIAVDTGQKTVTLNGTVASGEQKTRADQIAQNTKGVKAVVDDISVNPNAAATAGRYDEQTTTEKAKTKTEDAAHTAKVKTERAASKTGEVIEDSAITSDLKTKFLAEPGVPGAAIHVETTNGVVMLSGNVKTKAEEDKALSITRGTTGVKRVVNHMKVVPSAAATSGRYDEQTTTEKAKAKTEDTAHSAKVKTERAASKTGEVIEDAAITTDVKTKFLAESGVPGTDIHVETTNGVVTLSGNVKTKAEEDKALSIAHASKGVKRVVNHMKVAA